MEKNSPLHFIECKTSARKAGQSLRYLKARFPGVEATQVVLDKNVDLVMKEGIRPCSANVLLKDLV